MNEYNFEYLIKETTVFISISLLLFVDTFND